MHELLTSSAPPGPERPVNGRSQTRWLIVCGGLAPVVLWVIGAIVALTWPGYDPIAESISVMVHAPLGWLQTAAFWIQGGLGIAWAIGASRVMGKDAGQRRVVRILFLLQAAIGFAFAILPADADGTHETVVGQLHLANFYLYAISMPITLFVLARIFRGDPAWRGAVVGTRIAGLVMLVSAALAPLTVAGPLLPYLGLLERVYVAIPSVWQLAVAALGLRIWDRQAC